MSRGTWTSQRVLRGVKRYLLESQGRAFHYAKAGRTHLNVIKSMDRSENKSINVRKYGAVSQNTEDSLGSLVCPAVGKLS